MSSSIVCARLFLGFVKKVGCLDYRVYQDLDEEHAFCIVAEWETHETMQKHFLTQNFVVLIGAARVLGETFEINIGEVLKTGGFKLAKEQIASQDKVRGVPG